MTPRPSVARVFAVPLLIGVITAAGLLAALLFEPFGRYASWIALGLPIAVVIWAYRRRQRF